MSGVEWSDGSDVDNSQQAVYIRRKSHKRNCTRSGYKNVTGVNGVSLPT